MEHWFVGELEVFVAEDDRAMGEAAAADFAVTAGLLLAEREEISVVMATAPSQASFHRALSGQGGIDWGRVNLFHLDELVGVGADDRRSMAWQGRQLAERLGVKEFFPLNGLNDPMTEARRYTEILNWYRPAIGVLGIGETGHLAFNDPPADFATDHLMAVVELAEGSKRQMVGEGGFADLAAVPSLAVSMTVPGLLRPEHLIVVVPEERKAAAVKGALQGPVDPGVPASILQTAPQARMYLDRAAASLLDWG